MHFTVPAIARLLDVSTTTVTRRMRAYGIGIRRLYSQVSDRRLDEVVREITGISKCWIQDYSKSFAD